MTQASTRALRHNIDAEAAILGGILIRNDVLLLLGRLEVDCFYDFRHKVVFQAMRELEASTLPIDVVTLENQIERAGKLDAIGGVAFLGELTLRVPTAENVLAYADIVEQLAMTRRLAVVASELVERCYDLAYEPEALLEWGMTELGRLDRAPADNLAQIGTLAKRRLGELDQIARERFEGKPATSGAPTGIGALDRFIGGYPWGVVSMIAARPAMGKSAAAIAAADACTKWGFGVHVFSLEDSWQTYTDRCLARRSGVSAKLIRQGDLTGSREGQIDHTRLVGAVAELGQRPTWYVDDSKGLTASDIIRSVRQHKKRIGTRLVIVDYVHLVKRNPRLEENQALDEIITAFSQAVQPDEAWLVLSQLNREVEKRPDKRPSLSDLRGSGALEERPKLILGLYRGSYYGGDPRRGIDYDCADCSKTLVTCSHAPTEAEWAKQAQVLVLKNSNGACEPVKANWRGPTTEIW